MNLLTHFGAPLTFACFGFVNSGSIRFLHVLHEEHCGIRSRLFCRPDSSFKRGHSTQIYALARLVLGKANVVVIESEGTANHAHDAGADIYLYGS